LLSIGNNIHVRRGGDAAFCQITLTTCQRSHSASNVNADCANCKWHAAVYSGRWLAWRRVSRSSWYRRWLCQPCSCAIPPDIRVHAFKAKFHWNQFPVTYSWQMLYEEVNDVTRKLRGTGPSGMWPLQSTSLFLWWFLSPRW